MQVIDQLGGVALPASAWETLVLPARLRNYTPAWLDELTMTGEVLWSGAGALPGSDGWISLHLAESAAVTLFTPEDTETTELQREILVTLAGGGAYFFRQLSNAVGSTDDASLTTAIWDLVWAGLITNDTFSPLRSHLGGKAAPRRAPRARAYRGRGRPTLPSQSGPPSVGGRWSLLPLAEGDTTIRAKATAELLLERHGIVTRGAVASEGIRGGFALVYKVLSTFEETGRARRGYFVDGLGGAQFATGATVDRLRQFDRLPDVESRGYAESNSLAEATSQANGQHPGETPGGGRSDPMALTLAATDPANAYGAALPWPEQNPTETEEPGENRRTGHRPGRKAGALVVLVDGFLVLYIERGGKTVLTFSADEQVLAAAATSLATTVRAGLGQLRIERVDGEFSVGTPLGDALVGAGFAATPQGIRLRA